jgi:hypothetical protein
MVSRDEEGRIVDSYPLNLKSMCDVTERYELSIQNLMDKGLGEYKLELDLPKDPKDS